VSLFFSLPFTLSRPLTFSVSESTALALSGWLTILSNSWVT
jgi:hypothetical protein